MHKDNTNKKKGDAKLWYLERSRNGSQIREKVKKKAESGESQQGEGRRMHKRDMQEMVKNVMTRTRREKM